MSNTSSNYKSALLDSYTLLEGMIKKAERDDAIGLEKLKKEFDKRYMSIHTEIDPALARSYENCRQSCVFSQQLVSMKDDYIKDAKEIFSHLPKP